MEDRENFNGSMEQFKQNSYEQAGHKGMKEEIKHALPNSSIEKRTAHRSSASSNGLQNYISNQNSVPTSIVSGGGIGLRAFGKDLSNLNYPQLSISSNLV
jgi:hypothetical protein